MNFFEEIQRITKAHLELSGITALPTLDCPKHGRVRVAVKPHPVVSINDYVCPECDRVLWSDRFVVRDKNYSSPVAEFREAPLIEGDQPNRQGAGVQIRQQGGDQDAKREGRE